MYKDRDIPWRRWIWWQKSLYICSKSHSPSLYFRFQTSYVFRAENNRLPWVKANFLRIFPGQKSETGLFHVLGTFGNVCPMCVRTFWLQWSRRESRRTIALTMRITRPKWSGTHQDGWLISMHSAPTAPAPWVSCSELFIHFKAFWACLVVIDTTDKAHGAHCRAWRSPGRRTQKREREERER